MATTPRYEILKFSSVKPKHKQATPDMIQRPQKSRQRNFASKSRNGCDICKSGHVRCDASRPSCLRCLRLGRACTYTRVPREWTFQSNKSSTNKPGNSTLESSSENRISEDPVLEADELLPLSTQPGSSWASTNDVQVLQFFLECAGPRTAYRSPFPSFWLDAVPRIAWHDETIRHALSSVSVYFSLFLGQQSRETEALRYYTRAINSWSRSGSGVVPALIMSQMFSMVCLAIGDSKSRTTHRIANYRIYTSILNDTHESDDTRALAAQMQRANLGFHEDLYDEDELLSPVTANADIISLFHGLRAARQRFDVWLSACPRPTWLRRGNGTPMAQWSGLAARCIISKAWNLCVFPGPLPTDNNIGVQTMREQQVLRSAGIAPVPTTTERLNELLDELITPQNTYLVDALTLDKRLKAVGDAYVGNMLDLLEMYKVDPWICRSKKEKVAPLLLLPYRVRAVSVL